MKKFEIIYLYESNFVNLADKTIYRFFCEIEAKSYHIEDGIGIFYNDGVMVGSVPVDKVIVR